jgi:hypothetical protein
MDVEGKLTGSPSQARQLQMWSNMTLHRMNYIFTEQRASTIVAYIHVCVLESQRL